MRSGASVAAVAVAALLVGSAAPAAAQSPSGHAGPVEPGTVRYDMAFASLPLGHHRGAIELQVTQRTTTTSTRVIAVANIEHCYNGGYDGVCMLSDPSRARIPASDFQLSGDLRSARLSWSYKGRPLRVTWFGTQQLYTDRGGRHSRYLFLESRDGTASGSWGSLRWRHHAYEPKRDAGTLLGRRIDRQRH